MEVLSVSTGMSAPEGRLVPGVGKRKEGEGISTYLPPWSTTVGCIQFLTGVSVVWEGWVLSSFMGEVLEEDMLEPAG